jgi:hypothetical protein
MSPIRWLLLPGLLVVLASPQSVWAQSDGGKDYRQLPLEGGAETLKKRLVESGNLDELAAKLLRRIQKNPEKYPDLIEQLKKQSAGKPADGDQAKAKQQADELFKNAGIDPKKVDAEQFEKLKKNLEKQVRENNEKLDFHPPLDPKDGKGPGDKVEPVPPKPPHKALPPKDEPFDKAAKALLKDINKGKYGETAKNNEALKHLDEQLGKGRAGKKSSAADVMKHAVANVEHRAGGSKVSLPPDWLKLSNSGEHTPHADQGGAASLGGGVSPPGAPSLGLSGPSIAGGGLALLQILLILAVLAVIAVAVWRLLGRARRRDVQAALRQSIWPLPPTQVTTRAQLIQAFEHLALVVLGPEARTTNHRDIADNLGTVPEHTQAADELATLYERARYDPVEGELPASDLAAARRDLCLLAGMAAS